MPTYNYKEFDDIKINYLISSFILFIPIIIYIEGHVYLCWDFIKRKIENCIKMAAILLAIQWQRFTSQDAKQKKYRTKIKNELKNKQLKIILF